jgi:pantoate--beta-alanine ligase
MAQQFALPVEIIPAQTIRDADGLALSSRNGYLTSDERIEAPELYKILQQMQESIHLAQNPSQQILKNIEQAAKELIRARGWQPDYLAIRQQHNLLEPTPEQLAQNVPLVILAAAKLGKTRLIDNLEV